MLAIVLFHLGAKLIQRPKHAANVTHDHIAGNGADRAGIVAVAAVIALLIRALLFEPIRVDGESMRDTLQDNEIVLVTKPDYLAGNFNRGDVIICRYPNRNSKTSLQLGGTLEVSFVNHTLFVKRLIALPGDLLQIVEGAVYVNG